MSTDCENILKKFLVLNPVKRATLEVCDAFCANLLALMLYWIRHGYCAVTGSSRVT